MAELSKTMKLTKNCGGRDLQFCKASITRTGKLSLSEWHPCRETFYQTWKSTPIICFGAKYPRRLLSFIRITEIRLSKLSGEEIPATKVGRTNCKGITWIEVSSWWRATAIRRSFFTEFIRAGSYYNRPLTNEEKAIVISPIYGHTQTLSRKADYWTAMMMRIHFRKTQPAVLRFLDGYTHYTGSRSCQWFTAMFHADYDDGPEAGPVCGSRLKKLLVKPPQAPATDDSSK